MLMLACTRDKLEADAREDAHPEEYPQETDLVGL